MKGVIPKIAFGLLGILILSAILLTLGQRENQAQPSASSYRPSGLNAFRELLQQNGIETEVTRLVSPALRPNDLAIAPYLRRELSIFGQQKIDETVTDSLKAHLRRGGNVLALPYQIDFRQASIEALESEKKVVETLTGKTLTIRYADHSSDIADVWNETTVDDRSLVDAENEIDFYPWKKKSDDSEDHFVKFTSIGDGIMADAADGLFVTNRFIDRDDDAQLALRLVRNLLGKDGRVVFTEATLGEGLQPSLVGILGPWAVGAWMQLLVLFAIVVVSLGFRFGLPEPERRAQRGQREMLDAIAHTYQRSGSSTVALDAAYQAANTRIRRAYKLPAGLSDAERDRLIPPELASLLQHIDHCRQPEIKIDQRGRKKILYRVDSAEARELAAKLDTLLNTHLPSAQNRIS